MDRIAEKVRAFVAEEDGAAIAEYGLLLAIVAVGMIAILTTFSTQVQTWWTNIQNALFAAPNAAP